MSDDKNEDGCFGNVIPFPMDRVNQKEKIASLLEIPETAIQDLVVTIACMNMATKYRGSFDKDCQDNLSKENFPCSANCGCYVHMLSSMALELIFEGPRSEEARNHVYKEYTALCEGRVPPESDDEF
tara:strand:- start:28253 stop:28633 length:381 start_codon:yes stop_codon:yes gene_type:complete